MNYLHLRNILGMPVLTGNAGEALTVNGTEDGFIFATGGTPVSFGTDNQIPFINATNNDFEYASDFTFNGTQLLIPEHTFGGTQVPSIASVTDATTGIKFTGDYFGSAMIEIIIEGGDRWSFGQGFGDVNSLVTTANGYIGWNSGSQVASGGPDVTLARHSAGNLVINSGLYVGTLVVNDAGLSTGDVRIEGDTLTHLLFTQASTDRVGINTNSPSELLHVNGTSQFGTAGSTLGVLKLSGNTSGTITIQPAAIAGTWTFTLPNNDGTTNFVLKTDGSGTTDWVDVNTLATDTNFANTDLTLTGTRVHDGGGFDLSITNVGDMILAATSSVQIGSTADIILSANASGNTFSLLNGGQTALVAANNFTVTAPYVVMNNELRLGVNASSTGILKFLGATSGIITIQPAAAAGTYGLVLPTAQASGAQYLKNDGSGNLSWDSPAGAGTVTDFIFTDANGFDGTVSTSTTTPTLSLTTTVADTRVMYSSSGAIVGAAGMVFDGTSKLSLGVAGASSGKIDIAGSTSGVISLLPQVAAGTYNWNWPTTAGASGYFLTSAGGAGAPMTWTAPPTTLTANNGINIDTGVIQLGGDLVENTVIGTPETEDNNLDINANVLTITAIDDLSLNATNVVAIAGGSITMTGVTNDDTKVRVLVVDGTTNQVYYRAVSSIGGGGITHGQACTLAYATL